MFSRKQVALRAKWSVFFWGFGKESIGHGRSSGDVGGETWKLLPPYPKSASKTPKDREHEIQSDSLVQSAPSRPQRPRNA
jgi:hypothetical protein